MFIKSALCSVDHHPSQKRKKRSQSMHIFVLSFSFRRNVPGQCPPRDEYCGLPSHYFPQGGATHPRNEVGRRGASSHVPVAPGPQLGMGHGTSLQQPPMGRNHHPASHQLYPAQPANVQHPLQPVNFVQPRQMGPMIATRSQFQGSVGVQNPPGRLSYEQS
jgi:hypothetical protein